MKTFSVSYVSRVLLAAPALDLVVSGTARRRRRLAAPLFDPFAQSHCSSLLSEHYRRSMTAVMLGHGPTRRRYRIGLSPIPSYGEKSVFHD